MNYNEFEKIFERSKNDPIPEVYINKKLAIFLIGAPASGKSHYIQSEILRKNVNFKIIDRDQKSDILTKHLSNVSKYKNRVDYMKYKNILTSRIETYPFIRNLNRELEMQFEVSLHEGTNIIYDSTGNNKKLLTYLINKCNEFDYKIVFIHVLGKNLEWQLEQSKLRAAKTGRPVDEDYLIDLYKRSQSFIKYYTNLNIDNYYVIWNRGINKKSKYYRVVDNIIFKKSGNKWKKVIKSKSEKNVLHAFDLDNTLIDSPKFSDFFYKQKGEIKEIIDNKLKKLGYDRKDIVIKNNRIYLPNNEILETPYEFYASKESFGDKLNYDLIKIFNNAKNKCIITGRNITIKDIVIDILNKHNIKPNKGLYLCPENIIKTEEIAIWKSEVLNDLCDKYDTVHFYEDKISWINIIKKMVDKPNLVLHFVIDGKIEKALNYNIKN